MSDMNLDIRLRATFYDHTHGFVNVRWPRVLAVLAFLHLPYGWLVKSGELPHDLGCDPYGGLAVLRETKGKLGELIKPTGAQS